MTDITETVSLHFFLFLQDLLLNPAALCVHIIEGDVWKDFPHKEHFLSLGPWPAHWPLKKFVEDK